MTVRVAVVGLGAIGNLHAGLYKEMPRAQLVGVCDIDQERARKASQRFGVPAFYSVAELMKSLAPDMVSVATGGYEYGSDHYQPTIEALEAGAHVLCEKPISNEIAKAEDALKVQLIIEAAIKSWDTGKVITL